MIYIEDIDSVLIYINKDKGDSINWGGTCWHNARWNVGILGLMNDFFLWTNFPAFLSGMLPMDGSF